MLSSTSSYLFPYQPCCDGVVRPSNDIIDLNYVGNFTRGSSYHPLMVGHSQSSTSTSFVGVDDQQRHTYDSIDAAVNASADVSSNLERFSDWYQGVHGYLSVVVCIFGSASNLANVAVLTRPSMATPTNVLLTGIAAADLLTMAAYLPYAVYFYCLTAPDASYGHRRSTIVYLLFHTNFIITCHTVAMWLTVSLAVFRYFAVCRTDASSSSSSSARSSSSRFMRRRPALATSASYLSLKSSGTMTTTTTTTTSIAIDSPASSSRQFRRHDRTFFQYRIFNQRGAKATVVAVLLMTVIFCLPIYGTYVPTPVVADEMTALTALTVSDGNAPTTASMTLLIRRNGTVQDETDTKKDADEKGNETWWIGYSAIVTPAHLAFNFWLYGVVLKVAPCVLLTVLGARLVVAVRAAGLHRLRLRRLSSSSANHRGFGSSRSAAPANGPTATSPNGTGPVNHITATGSARSATRRSSLAPSQLAVDREHSRTTVTLVAVVLSFVATELPQGVVSLLSAVDQTIFDRVYVPLGDLWDLLILVNSAVNFVLYCTMSRQYRQTFRRVFIDDFGARFRRLVGGRRCVRCLRGAAAGGTRELDDRRGLDRSRLGRFRRVCSTFCRLHRGDDQVPVDVPQPPGLRPLPFGGEVIAIDHDDVGPVLTVPGNPRLDPDADGLDVVGTDEQPVN